MSTFAAYDWADTGGKRKGKGKTSAAAAAPKRTKRDAFMERLKTNPGPPWLEQLSEDEAIRVHEIITENASTDSIEIQLESETGEYRPIKVAKNDFRSFRPGITVTDAMIESTLKVICAESDTFCYISPLLMEVEADDGKFFISEARKRNRPVTDFENVLIPIHLGNHWELGLWRPASKMFTIYNSLSGMFDEEENKFVAELRERLEGIGEIVSVERATVPQQNNTKDCGIFLLGFALALVRGQPVDTIRVAYVWYLRYYFGARLLRSAPEAIVVSSDSDSDDSVIIVES